MCTLRLSKKDLLSCLVCVVDSRTSNPGFSAAQGHCILFLGKTHYSNGVSLQVDVVAQLVEWG